MTTTLFPGETQNQVPECQELHSVRGEHLVERVKEFVLEGNVRRLIIKQSGHILVEIPATRGVIETLFSPTLDAVAAIGLKVSDCTVEVIRDHEIDCPQD